MHLDMGYPQFGSCRLRRRMTIPFHVRPILATSCGTAEVYNAWNGRPHPQDSFFSDLAHIHGRDLRRGPGAG